VLFRKIITSPKCPKTRGGMEDDKADGPASTKTAVLENVWREGGWYQKADKKWGGVFAKILVTG